MNTDRVLLFFTSKKKTPLTPERRANCGTFSTFELSALNFCLIPVFLKKVTPPGSLLFLGLLLFYLLSSVLFDLMIELNLKPCGLEWTRMD
jgi:hypothetical protein